MNYDVARTLTVARTFARPRVWISPEQVALSGIVALSAVLNFLHLDHEGYANTYYAAAVKSMLQSWHNFFFVSFDPGGFVAVDKPPLGLWIQTASAKLFGFGGVSLLLPQALAGVLAVVLLYRLVARIFGAPAGLIAALVLALTPIAVVDSRNNTSDSVLILVLLLAAWAVMRAVEAGRLRWLLLAAVFVGLGFNIKELEAYLVLPAVMLVYLVGSRGRWFTRIWQLLLAGFTVLAVSFAWILAIDLTPAGQRPYVSDSGTNSELSLALGYNGFGRLATGLLSHLSSLPLLHIKLDFSIVPAISMEIGNPSWLRLIQPAIGAQVSWLLVCALVGLIVAFARLRPTLPKAFAVGADACNRPGNAWTGPARLALVFWGTWLVTLGIFFSVARFYHLYYLAILAPVIAALAGVGLAALWQDYRESLASSHPRWWQGWLLPLTVAGTAVVQAHVLHGYASWNSWLVPAVLVLASLAAIALAAGRLGIRLVIDQNLTIHLDARAMLAAAGLGIASLLIAPTAFAADAVASGNGSAWLPQAGPSLMSGFGLRGAGGGPAGTALRGGGTLLRGPALPRGTAPPNSAQGPGLRAGGGGGALTFAGSQTPTLDARLLRYLKAHRGTARYLVATTTSSYASLLILDTGQPVMTLGGYQGWDKILTLKQLRQTVTAGTVRFFLLPSSGSGSFGGGLSQFGPGGGSSALTGGVDANLDTVNNALISWVRTTCTAVKTSLYQTSSRQSSTTRTSFGGFGSQSPGLLYDCGALRTTNRS